MAEAQQDRTIVVVMPLQNVTKLRTKLLELRDNTSEIHIASKAREFIEEIIDALVEALPDVKAPAPVQRRAPAPAPRPAARPAAPPTLNTANPSVFSVEGDVDANAAIALLQKAGLPVDAGAPSEEGVA